jgi:methyl acetate hydrolase
MHNGENAPTGHRAGALDWAGLANIYDWIDRRSGIAGLWAIQIRPLADGPTLHGYLDFGSAVYQALEGAI